MLLCVTLVVGQEWWSGRSGKVFTDLLANDTTKAVSDKHNRAVFIFLSINHGQHAILAAFDIGPSLT